MEIRGIIIGVPHVPPILCLIRKSSRMYLLKEPTYNFFTDFRRFGNFQEVELFNGIDLEYTFLKDFHLQVPTPSSVYN
jgi:hypothetical protein